MTARAQVELPELVERLRNAAANVEETKDADNDTHCTFLPFTSWSMKSMLTEAADAIAESEARAEGDARDAARYRKLRNAPLADPWGTPRIAIPADEKIGEFVNEEDADAAIDAAIAQEAEREAASGSANC